MSNRKGMELTMNTIVIAAIAIIVLATLLFFYGRQAQIFGSATSDYCTCDGVDSFRNDYDRSCPEGMTKRNLPVKEDCTIDDKDVDSGYCCVSVEDLTSPGGDTQ